jgi:hypothetical protein
MLSKTAMALVPAASLVGAAALAPTTSLTGEDHGFVAVSYPYCQENAWDSKCRGEPTAHSRAKERS